MKFQSATTILAAAVLAASSLDSVSSFVPTSITRSSAVVQGQHNTQLSVASQEIVDGTDIKPRKTREVGQILIVVISFGFASSIKPFNAHPLTHSPSISSFPNFFKPTGATRSCIKGIASPLRWSFHSPRRC